MWGGGAVFTNDWCITIGAVENVNCSRPQLKVPQLRIEPGTAKTGINHSVGKGGDYDIPVFGAPPRGQTGGQNFALCPALRSRKSLRGKDLNVKPRYFACMHCYFACTAGTLEIAPHFSPANFAHPFP